MKKEESGRGCFECKSIAEKQDFRVMTVSHWLSCKGGGRFLAGDAMYIFPCWDLKLMVLSSLGFFY